MAKVDRDSGPNGGDRLNIRAGGTLRVFGIGTGGAKICGSGGTIAANIAARSVTLATGGQTLATKHNAAIASLASGMNSMLTVLKNIGILATS